MESKSKGFLRGLKASVPVILGFVPVAIAFAIMAGSAGLTSFESVAMSVMVFAGASQMMAVGMIAEGAGYLAIVVATFIMNLRHLIMSTCIFERMNEEGKRTPLPVKILCSFGVTDESFAIFTTTDKGKCSSAYFLGIFIGTYSSWVVGTLIGTMLGAILPDAVSDSLGISLYAMFIALLVPKVKSNVRLLLVVLITAAINFVLGRFIDSSWSLVISTLLGAGIGMFIVPDDHEKENDEQEVAE